VLTYEYECGACGLKFAHRQAMTEQPLTECPQCRGKVQRLISGGSGFMLKGSYHELPIDNRRASSLEQSGRTCCGQEERCGKSPCGG